MKKLMALMMASTMAFSMIGCGGGNETPAADNEETATTSKSPDELSTEITWWAFPTFPVEDGVSGKYEESLVAKFNEKYPNIKVNVEMIDFANGPEKIQMAVQGGTAPDVLFDAPGRIIDYGTSGYLVSLDDIFDESGLEDDITSENILKACSDGSTYWMYPTSAAPFVMAVNKTVLEKEGLLDQVPLDGDRTWTTEEFEALSKTMQEKGYKGVEIYCGAQGGDQGTRAFISNLSDAKIMNDDLTAYVLDDAAGVEAFDITNTGVEEGWLEGNTAGAANDALEHFTTPTNSTFWAVCLWSPNLANGRAPELEASNIEAEPVCLPSKSGTPSLEYLVNGFCVFDNKDADKIAASKEFIKFLCDDETVGKEIVVKTNCFPVRKSFGDLYEGDDLMAYYGGLSKYYGPYYNTVPGFASMRPFWWGSLQAMLTGEKTPEEAAKYFTENANPTLDE